jgi:hypothetical protein
MFYPFDKELLKKKVKGNKAIIPHRSLLAYGRQIFRLCVASVLAGATQVRMRGLDAALIPNADRVKEICKRLNESTPADKRLLSVNQEVYELRDETYDLVDPDVVAVKSVIGVVRLALQAYKEACPPTTKPVEESIDKVLSGSGQPSLALLTQIEECAGQLRSGRVMTDRSQNARLTDLIIALLEYASKPSFRLQCYYRETHKPPEGDTAPS